MLELFVRVVTVAPLYANSLRVEGWTRFVKQCV